MSIVSQITSQKFLSQYRNGETFSLLPDDFTTWLLGNAGENLRVITDIDISVDTGILTNEVKANGNIIQRSAGNWFNEGFSLGDTIIAYTSGGNQAAPNILNAATITYIDATTVEVDTVVSNPSGSSFYGQFRMYATSDLEGLFFKYNLINNTGEALNFDSKIDFNPQEYSVNGLVTSGSAETMAAQNSSNIKSWINGTVTAQYIGSQQSGTIKQYQIVHDFTILPYYLDGWLGYLQTGQLPPLFAQGNSLKYVFEANFRKTINNPNENKIVTQENVLGNVGFWDQNFNGFTNLFSTSGLAITETVSGASSTAIIVGTKTRLSFQINRSSGVFAGTENVIFGISRLPEQAVLYRAQSFRI